METGLEDQHILITGSAGGIGFHTSKAFLDLGCKVTLHYNNQIEPLKELLDAYPGRCAAIKADCTQEKEVVACVKESVSKLGPINVIVINHATFASENVSVCDMTLDQWNNTINVNLTGSFLFAREYLRGLRDHVKTLDKEAIKKFNASIVFIGSTAGKFGEAYHADYSSSKSAMMYGFMRSIKNEIVKIVPTGRINCVAPGWVYTKMAEESVKKGEHFKALQTTPLKKIANVQDVSNAIIMLSSQLLTNHCSGTIIEVDGGMEGRVLNSLDDLKQ